MALVVSYLAGIIFGAGLVIGGMTQPGKVIGFLDFAGNWDPSLAMVMGGAVAVYAIGYRIARWRGAPLLAPSYVLPSRTHLEPRLLAGAAIFGVGWGLGGFCPGPALTALFSGHAVVLLFVASMAAGMYLCDLVPAQPTLIVASRPSAPGTHSVK
jgi:uncharacterized membrane protein YedE/YeeE